MLLVIADVWILLEHIGLRWFPLHRRGLSCFEAHKSSLLPLLRSDFRIIQFDQGGEHFDDEESVLWVVSTWVLGEPEHSQGRKMLEVSDFVDVRDLILPEVDLLDLSAMLEVLQTADLIQGEGRDLQIGQVFQHS